MEVLRLNSSERACGTRNSFVHRGPIDVPPGRYFASVSVGCPNRWHNVGPEHHMDVFGRSWSRYDFAPGLYGVEALCAAFGEATEGKASYSVEEGKSVVVLKGGTKLLLSSALCVLTGLPSRLEGGRTKGAAPRLENKGTVLVRTGFTEPHVVGEFLPRLHGGTVKYENRGSCVEILGNEEGRVELVDSEGFPVIPSGEWYLVLRLYGRWEDSVRGCSNRGSLVPGFERKILRLAEEAEEASKAMASKKDVVCEELGAFLGASFGAKELAKSLEGRLCATLPHSSVVLPLAATLAKRKGPKRSLPPDPRPLKERMFPDWSLEFAPFIAKETEDFSVEFGHILDDHVRTEIERDVEGILGGGSPSEAPQ